MSVMACGPVATGKRRLARRRGALAAAATDATMMIRCTARLLKTVSKLDPAAVDMPPADDDWYANIMWIEGRKCLHAAHAATLFAIFAPDVRDDDLQPPGPFLAARVAERLASEGLPADALGDLDGAHAAIGNTATRQILGCMNDQAFAIRWIVEQDGGLARAGLGGIHRHLQNNIVSARKFRSPLDLIADRLVGA